MEYKAGIVNIVITLICVILLLSPLSQKTGSLHSFLTVPFFYTVISFIPAGFVSVIGFKNIFKRSRDKKYTAVIILNIFWFIFFFFTIALKWQDWMSI